MSQSSIDGDAGRGNPFSGSTATSRDMELQETLHPVASGGFIGTNQPIRRGQQGQQGQQLTARQKVYEAKSYKTPRQPGHWSAASFADGRNRHLCMPMHLPPRFI